MSQYRYDASFFAYTSASNQASAEAVVALLKQWFPHIGTVVDFGCGQGVWLAAWNGAGATEVLGLDGDYVDRSQLRINSGQFRATDLALMTDLGRRFDLVQSVEVAEHLPASAAAGFAEMLGKHGDLLLFSAAPPGQGGEHHVNEQPYDYWRKLLSEQGFVAYDCIRSRLAGRPEIQPWYRYNLVLYARPNVALPEAVRVTRVPEGRVIPDISPRLYQLRKAVVRRIPPALADQLARWKARRA